MNRLELYIPKVEDYWYEERIQSDPDTMNYNAGWNVSYYGYHYDTGCIDFPKSKWEETYNKRKNENKFFAYLLNKENKEFIGYVNYQFNKDDDRYNCGILIESIYRNKGYAKEGLELLCNHAKAHGIKELYDDFENDRIGTKIFTDLGFKEVDKYQWTKFNKPIEIIVVKREL